MCWDETPKVWVGLTARSQIGRIRWDIGNNPKDKASKLHGWMVEMFDELKSGAGKCPKANEMALEYLKAVWRVGRLGRVEMDPGEWLRLYDAEHAGRSPVSYDEDEDEDEDDDDEEQ